MERIINRIKGTIYGQAIGDALGLGTEGMTDEDMAWKYPNGISHYSDIFQDRHRKRWKVGDWTDDTDMMLCIANAVIKDKGVNYTSIARNFKIWDSMIFLILSIGGKAHLRHSMRRSGAGWRPARARGPA